MVASVKEVCLRPQESTLPVRVGPITAPPRANARLPSMRVLRTSTPRMRRDQSVGVQMQLYAGTGVDQSQTSSSGHEPSLLYYPVHEPGPIRICQYKSSLPTASIESRYCKCFGTTE